MIGGAADALTGGDPLAADYRYEEPEKGEVETSPSETMEGAMDRETYGEVIEAVDERLDRGFREAQKIALRSRAAKLAEGEQFHILCNVYHGGAPTGYQIWVARQGGGLNLAVEGRGPAMTVLGEELQKRGVLREGVFRKVFHEESRRPARAGREGSGAVPVEHDGWVSELPLEYGTFFGRQLGIEVDRYWPGLSANPDPAKSPLFLTVLRSLPEILGRAEVEFRSYQDEEAEQAIAAIESPRIWFPEEPEDEECWTLVVNRKDWPDFGWHLEFRGAEFVEVWAGD